MKPEEPVKGTGRTGKSNYASYLQFMKNQLTELLTNYGEIMCIWFDGHWDQTNPEGTRRTERHASTGSMMKFIL
jgi:alpha-L-fucosidase